MIDLIDFTKYRTTIFGYGGMSGKKKNIIIDGKQYMLKFPDNLKLKNFKNVNLTYSNGPICEWLGSHVYESIGIPVHHTFLGTYGDKTVVACRHIYDDERLVSFAEFRNTLLDSTSPVSTSVSLPDVLESLSEMDEQVKGAKERFWDMFVVDAFIGNPDRNNGNWGFLFNDVGIIPPLVSLAPVYDNGSSFNPKWDEQKFADFLNDETKLKAASYSGVVSIFTNEKERHINPFKFIESGVSQDCTEAVLRIVPKIDLGEVWKLISELHDSGLIGEKQAEFYEKITEKRMDEKLLPLYEEFIRAEEYAAPQMRM